MRTLLTAAGNGSRLRAVTDTPKPLLNYQGQPLIRWWFEKVTAAWTKEVLISTHYQDQQIIAEFHRELVQGTAAILHERERYWEPPGTLETVRSLIGDGERWRSISYHLLGLGDVLLVVHPDQIVEGLDLKELEQLHILSGSEITLCTCPTDRAPNEVSQLIVGSPRVAGGLSPIVQYWEKPCRSMVEEGTPWVTWAGVVALTVTPELRTALTAAHAKGARSLGEGLRECFLQRRPMKAFPVERVISVDTPELYQQAVDKGILTG